MTTRRGFLGALLAAAAAPAFVRAEVLMPVRQIIVPDQEIAPPVEVWHEGPAQPFLKLGDLFTIGGMVQVFRVTRASDTTMTIASGHVVPIEILGSAQAKPEKQRAMHKPNPSRVPMLPGRGRWS